MPTPVALTGPDPSRDGIHGIPEHSGVVVAQVHEDVLGLVLKLLQSGCHGTVDFLLRRFCSVFQFGGINAHPCSAVQCIVLQNLHESKGGKS